jgi:SsrA-binding protein
VLTENKKARFDYEIIESFEAGVVLTGSEVKSARAGGVTLRGARVVIKEDGAYVIGMNIQRYKFDSNPDYVADRSKKLLIKKKEMIEIGTKMKSAGLTLVPVKLYNKGSLLKLEIALVRGKKKFEKREILKKRETNLGLARRLKNKQ